jgi:hypothetical protein
MKSFKQYSEENKNQDVLSILYKLKQHSNVGRIRISDLRSALPQLNRDELDDKLLKLQSMNQIVLYHGDDPLELTEKDHRDALVTITGNKRHFVYIK